MTSILSPIHQMPGLNMLTAHLTLLWRHAAMTGKTHGGGNYINDPSTFSKSVLVANNAGYAAITGNVIAGRIDRTFAKAGRHGGVVDREVRRRLSTKVDG